MSETIQTPDYEALAAEWGWGDQRTPEPYATRELMRREKRWRRELREEQLALAMYEMANGRDERNNAIVATVFITIAVLTLLSLLFNG